MKKWFAIGLGVLTALVGGFLAFAKMPSYRGPVDALSKEQQALATRLRGHVQVLGGDIGARSLTSSPAGLERAATYIEEAFAKSGFKPQRQTFSVSTQSTCNLMVEIPGTTKANEIVVIGAHYDGVQDSPAANDNGTGVAALLEIAGALAQEKFPRTVFFVAFTNEEPPFFRSEDMGSYRYAKACKDRGDSIVAMVSLETLGYYSDKPDSQRFPAPPLALVYPTAGNFVAFVGNMDARDTLNKCHASFLSAVKFPAEVLAAPPDLAGVDFSDQLSFWKVGYPGIMVTDTAVFRYPHYHTKDDTPDKVDYGKLAQVTSGMMQVVRDLARN